MLIVGTETRRLAMTVENLIKENFTLGERVCVICSKTFYGFGNNPAPIKFSGKCCNDCDAIVIKARLEKIIFGSEK